jgi:hypothetical protein
LYIWKYSSSEPYWNSVSTLSPFIWYGFSLTQIFVFDAGQFQTSMENFHHSFLRRLECACNCSCCRLICCYLLRGLGVWLTKCWILALSILLPNVMLQAMPELLCYFSKLGVHCYKRKLSSQGKRQKMIKIIHCTYYAIFQHTHMCVYIYIYIYELHAKEIVCEHWPQGVATWLVEPELTWFTGKGLTILLLVYYS